MGYVPQRLDRLYRVMRDEAIDAMIITRGPDIRYLTGYATLEESQPVACVVIGGQPPVLVTSDQQLAVLKNNGRSMLKVVSSVPEAVDEWSPVSCNKFWERLADVLKDYNLVSGKIGLQYDHLTLRDFNVLKSILPRSTFKDMTESFWRLRQIKDAVEIDTIRHATRVVDIGLLTALEVVVPGRSELEASIEIETAMRAAGGQSRGIRAVVFTGTGPYRPSVGPSSEKIRGNSMVIIDLAVCYDGYFSEAARTVHLGTPSESQRSLFRSVMATRQRLLQQIRPGASVEDVASTALKSISGITLCDMLGNSIGLDLREPPLIAPSSKASINEGMVFSLHPTFFTTDTGAVRVTDVIMVTSNGCEVLSSVSEETM